MQSSVPTPPFFQPLSKGGEVNPNLAESGWDSFTLGFLGKKLPGHPAKAATFEINMTFFQGSFMRGTARGSYTLAIHLQIELCSSCRRSIINNSSLWSSLKKFTKGTVYLSDVCYSAGQIHRWPLTLTFCITPSQTLSQRERARL